MFIQLVTEIVLGFITLMAGSFFWQIFKRNKFLTRAIHDGPFLRQLVSPDSLDNLSSMIVPFTQKLPQGYALNVQLAITSDTVALRRSKIIFGSVVCAALIGSYFLGLLYLVINTGIFFLSAIARVSQQARENAAQQILTLAVILDRWRSENTAECDQWIEQAWAFRQLYDAVLAARRAT